jgi:hypothetical protein
MENLRNQGAYRQIRILESLPIEIKGLLIDFAEQDKRDKEVTEAKEKRNVEVR